VLTRPSADDLARIFELKKQLVLMRKVLSPQRDVIGLLQARRRARRREDDALLPRRVRPPDAHHRVDRGQPRPARQRARGLPVVHSQRTNEIMKTVALSSAVFMPLTFITGFFGQNFDELPFHSHMMLAGDAASCIVVPIVLVIWFKRSKWF
jgi:magnesium transporter